MYKKFFFLIISSFMMVSLVVACVPGFFLYLVEYLKTNAIIINYQFLFQGVFWYLISLLFGLIFFFISLCFWCSSGNNDEDSKYEKMSVNILEKSPLLTVEYLGTTTEDEDY